MKKPILLVTMLLALGSSCKDKSTGEIAAFLCGRASGAASVGNGLMSEPPVAIGAEDPELLAIAAQECNQARNHYLVSSALLSAARSSDSPSPLVSDRLAAAHDAFERAAETLCPRPPDYAWTHDGKFKSGVILDRKKEMQARIDRMDAATLEMVRACVEAQGGNAPAKAG